MTHRGERIDKPSRAILRSQKGGSTGAVYEVDHKVFGRKCVQKTYSTFGLEEAIAHQEPWALRSLPAARRLNAPSTAERRAA